MIHANTPKKSHLLRIGVDLHERKPWIKTHTTLGRRTPYFNIIERANAHFSGDQVWQPEQEAPAVREGGPSFGFRGLGFDSA